MPTEGNLHKKDPHSSCPKWLDQFSGVATPIVCSDQSWGATDECKTVLFVLSSRYSQNLEWKCKFDN